MTRAANIKKGMSDMNTSIDAWAGDILPSQPNVLPKNEDAKSLEFGSLGNILKKAQSAVMEKAIELDKERNKILGKIANKDEASPQPVLT